MEKLDNLISKIDNLKADTEPQWGKMTAQHMVEHLSATLWISAGKVKVKCFTPENRLSAMQAFLESDKPMPRNFVSPAVGDDVPPLRFKTFEEAVKEFKSAYAAFQAYFKENPDVLVTNPAFGNLSFSQWKTFHSKHMTHHFTQFGLV